MLSRSAPLRTARFAFLGATVTALALSAVPALGQAFVWQGYEMEGQKEPMLACVMVTVPASKLIEPITDRMPAILEDADWTPLAWGDGCDA